MKPWQRPALRKQGHIDTWGQQSFVQPIQSMHLVPAEFCEAILKHAAESCVKKQWGSAAMVGPCLARTHTTLPRIAQQNQQHSGAL